jgi:hypothetical protein
MFSVRPLLLLLMTMIVITPSNGQRGHHQPPVVFTDESRLPAATYAHPDPKMMLQQANELKELSGTIPGDVESVSKGMISKDLSERLKKIEKLAKKLREEVQQ